MQVWVNGVELLNLEDLRFVNDGIRIDTFYVSTFHGGNTPDWGPLNDSYLWIDDIRISTNPFPVGDIVTAEVAALSHY